MPRVEADTKREIRDVAAELFVRNGFERTSLREIAERLGVTKAAVYYHYPSKADILRDLVMPFVEEAQEFMDKAGQLPTQKVLEGYFDVMYRHRDVYRLFLAGVEIVEKLELVTRVLEWRAAFVVLFFGEHAGPAQAASATVAIGGLQDCILLDGPVDEIRAGAVAAATAALGAGSERARVNPTSEKTG